ncbi:S8 family peptidase [Clostridium cylindrosporum]|uniref:Cell wall-associated protease WprA n=1 Tax=Clostridium cylindrosporum DSM 605 TaxID=1121307 RepID=A0A0J8D899_CLOCY|nr:S8 family peptidase [Clostridium cylindrosporum]KMT22092.1 cell wall-associated protease WprA [Clostridium cylindrosporum DSM 605]
MKKVFLSKLTVLITLVIFMFSSTVAFAAPISKKTKLSTSPKEAKVLSLNSTYDFSVKEGDNLWFKVNTGSIKISKTHLSVKVEGVNASISIFPTLKKAEEFNTHNDYFMREGSLSYPIAWNSNEYYVMLTAPKSGAIKLSINSEKKAPELYNRSIDLCPLELMAKDNISISKLLPELRGVRDNMLNSSETGKEITKVYYEVAMNMYLPLIKNKELRNTLLSEVRKINTLLNEVVNISNRKNSNYIIKSEDIDSLTKIKDILSSSLNKELKNKIDTLWKKLNLENYINKELTTFIKDKISRDIEVFTNSQVIVTTSSNINLNKVKNLVNNSLAKYNILEEVKVQETKTLFNKNEKTFIVNIPSKKYMNSLQGHLEKNSGINSVEENYVFYALDNDVNYNYQWSLENTSQSIPVKDMNGAVINLKGKRGSDINYKPLIDVIEDIQFKNIPIAVIDTGINYDLADFDGKVDLDKGYNFTNNTKNVMDDNGHGTHVSGIISAKANNNYSMTGVNQYSTIIPIKALNSYGAGNMFSIAQAIKYAVDSGAKVINMSLGARLLDGTPINPSELPFIEEALKYAIDKNVTVVAASGNESKNNLSYPASSEFSLSVGAINNKDERTGFSNYGKGLDIVAPGESVPSLLENGEVTYASGTSMAAPNASAVVGFLYSVDSNMTPKKVRDILYKTSRDIGKKGYDNEYGYGCVNLSSAVSKAIKERVVK